jgi:low affinity Fe/Cu permease
VVERWVRRAIGRGATRNGGHDPAHLVEREDRGRALRRGSELSGGMGRMDRLFTAIANRIASWAGQPAAFIIAFASIVLWGATGPLFGYSDTWQLVVNTSTTIITFLMVFLIQNAQNRDAAAMQAKLDELIRALKGARNNFIGIEHLTEIELEKIRAALEEECDDRIESRSSSMTVEQLIRRR